jgi:N-acetyl-anhydromuramyl-L-alanine amidase AmpD
MSLSTVQDGKVLNPRIVQKIFPLIEKGPMPIVHGIIVHQTKSPTAAATFNSYLQGNNGAHFLIEKDGTIYQTARIDRKTWHVGKLRARCLLELTCKPAKTWSPKLTHLQESQKSWPQRFPSNDDSIGIELVGEFLEPTKTYVVTTEQQNKSLKWLVKELQTTLYISATEIFRHPVASYKDLSEASTAVWQ